MGNSSIGAVHLWRLMRDLRFEVGDSWKWPGKKDCIRFALQELMEADDEMMRSSSPEYLRRRDETGNSWQAEIAMSIVMMLSYFSIEEELIESAKLAFDREFVIIEGEIDAVLVNLSVALYNLNSDSDDAPVGPHIVGAMSMALLLYEDMDVALEEINKVAAKVRARVAEKESEKYKYLKSGAVACPGCGGTNLDTFGSETDDMYHKRYILCLDCNKQWNDVYKLVDAEML